MGEETDREEGVDFTAINPVLESLSYPVTAAELVEEHGGREIERTNAEPITVEDLFGPMGEATFESAEDTRQMLQGQMPRDAVGRPGYTDRSATPDEPAEDGETL